MAEMSEVAVRAAFDRATASVAPSPDLLIRVQRGGRRRLRRAAAALAAVVAFLLVAGVAASGLPNMEGAPPASSKDRKPLHPQLQSRLNLLAKPTTGDLANDMDYQRVALDAWKSGRKTSWFATYYDDLIGKPHVVWAGTTPGGKAAVIAQEARGPKTPARPREIQGRYVLVGYIGDVGNGRPELLDDDFSGQGNFPLSPYLTGPKRDIFVVPDLGIPIERCSSVEFRLDAKVACKWEPLQKTNGAWVGRVDEMQPSTTLRAKGVAAPLSIANIPTLRPDLGFYRQTDRCLNWGNPGTSHPTVAYFPANRVPDWDRNPDLIRVMYGHTDNNSHKQEPFIQGRCGGWFAYGLLPSGTRFIISDRSYEWSPPHLVVVLVSGKESRAFNLGEIDPYLSLPVIAPLPNGEGIVVAQKHAELRWRANDGPWSETATSAALIPVHATEVEVTPESGVSTIVPLPR